MLVKRIRSINKKKTEKFYIFKTDILEQNCLKQEEDMIHKVIDRDREKLCC